MNEEYKEQPKLLKMPKNAKKKKKKPKNAGHVGVADCESIWNMPFPHHRNLERL